MTAKRMWMRILIAAVVLTVGVLPALILAQEKKEETLAVQKVVVSDGVELHYVEQGTGVPVVFVHGSLGDGGYWNDQVRAFAASGYRAIAYSRRYNPPNTNQARPGYSAVVDADDLAALIAKLQLGKVHVVGHSYGAFTALFLAVRHPEVVRTLVLAEAPAVSLLAHLSGERVAIGKTTFDDIQERMVKPMKLAFAKGDREAGLRAFLGYVLDDPQAWDKMPEAARQGMLAHAHEWDVMMTSGELFPELDPEKVRKITAPALLLSGENSYHFLRLIDDELERLLPHGLRIILHGASHRMWYEQPEACRKAVLDFWRDIKTLTGTESQPGVTHVTDLLVGRIYVPSMAQWDSKVFFPDDPRLTPQFNDCPRQAETTRRTIHSIVKLCPKCAKAWDEQGEHPEALAAACSR
jgi:pimeloyl-ACP methyl ester carboxylesterase